MRNIVKSALRCQYKLCLIFVLVFVMNVDADDSGGYREKFCEKIENIEPSSSFSFAELLHLKGFTHIIPNDITMVADGLSYRFTYKEIYSQNGLIDVKSSSYWLPWLEYPSKNKLAQAAPYDKDPHDPLDMAYYLSLMKHLFRHPEIVLSFTKKHIYCFDFYYPDSLPSSTLKKNNLKIVSYWEYWETQWTTAYAISELPRTKNGKKQEGLIIYRFEVDFGNLFYYQCVPMIINDESDLASIPYYYLQRETDPNIVRVVHPKIGNVTRAKLYPLAENVMSGYVTAKYLYLFDVDLGCVYAIQTADFRMYFGSQREFVLQRVNIPFEQFFKCDGASIESKFSFLSPDRCDTTIDSDIKNMYGRGMKSASHNVLEEEEPLGDFDLNSTKSTGWMIGPIFVVICILVAICLYLIWRQKKKNNINVTDSKSKSAKRTPAKRTPTKGTPTKGTPTRRTPTKTSPSRSTPSRTE